MFRENTMDYLKDLRAWAVNMASKTHEKNGATDEQVLSTAQAYLNFVSNFSVEDALAEHAKRVDYIENLRNKVEVDAALAEELTNARDALTAAKNAANEEEADKLLRAAEFSFEQVCETQAKVMSQAAGLGQPEALAREA